MARVSRPSLRPLLLSLLALALATGCLDSSPFIPRIEDTNFDPSLGVDLAASTRTASGLYYRDITVGAGTEVLATGTQDVSTAYTLYLRSGQIVQSGNYAFTVGNNESILGYDEGMRGMRVGGRRQLIIPPALGYGSQGTTGIPPNSILVYTVDLTSIP